ncbi:MAG TPA: caspase family protein [Chryseolinea sp.]|nr:caspase family protein [Chryseolinea sp.]
MSAKCVILLVLLGSSSLVVSAQFKLYEKGHDSYTAGNYSDAITNFSLYLTKPTRDKAMDVEVFYLRALSYYKSSNYKNAIDDFQETLLLDHKNKGNIYWFMAKCYDKTNALSECVNSYNYALRELYDNKDSKCKILYERSLIHQRMNNNPQAYLDLKTLLAIQPTNADAKREAEKLEKLGIKAPPVVASNSQPVASRNTDGDKKNQPVTKSNQNLKQLEDKAATTKDAKTSATPGATQPVVTTPPLTPAQTLAEFFKDEKRYALIIGNSNYPKDIGVLKNPVNDATDFAKELQASNFEVQLLTNATYGQMRAAMLKFKEKVDAGDKEKTVSLFYYAGHGLQRDNENYLVPIDAAIEFEDDIARYCFPVQRMVLSNMERSNSRMNIVILDACRNNPFPALNRSLGDSGLGEMRRAMGSFIAYATAPGSVASDGIGRNGLYTQELLKAVRKPGLTIEQVFKEVRQNVLRLSGNKQNTWDSSNIIGEFYFKFQ